MSMFRTTWPLLVATGIALSAVSSVSHAAGALEVDLDGARILKLDSAASDVVIGNPFIADVTVQTPNRLVIIGKSPGVTNLIVMSDGAITMETQIVVSSRNAAARVSVLAPDGNNITETEFACGDRCTVVASTKRANGGGGGGGGQDNGGQGAIPTEPTVDQIPPPTPGNGGGDGGGTGPSY